MNLVAQNKWKMIFNRAGVLYLAIFLCFMGLYNEKGLFQKLRFKVLNRLRPYPGYMISYVFGKGIFNKREVEKYLYYYETIDRYLPSRADTYSMLGFCYAQKNDTKRAIANYLKSIELNPTFFWNYYNAGVVYYNAGDYPSAISYFEKAITAPQDRTLEYLFSSIIFRHLLDGIKFETIPEFMTHIEGDYKKVLTGLILSNYHLKDFKNMLAISKYALKSDEKNAWLYHYYAGIAFYELKDYPNAFISFQASLQLESTNTQAYRYLTDLYLAARRPAEAAAVRYLGNLFEAYDDPSLRNKETFFQKPF